MSLPHSIFDIAFPFIVLFHISYNRILYPNQQKKEWEWNENFAVANNLRIINQTIFHSIKVNAWKDIQAEVLTSIILKRTTTELA